MSEDEPPDKQCREGRMAKQRGLSADTQHRRGKDVMEDSLGTDDRKPDSGGPFRGALVMPRRLSRERPLLLAVEASVDARQTVCGGWEGAPPLHCTLRGVDELN